MALVARALEHFSVREDLKQLSADLDLGKHHAMSELLEQLIAIRMMGGEAISDTAMLKDDALGAFFDWNEVPHPCTFGRRLTEMRWSHNLGLQRIVTGLSDRVLRADQRLVATIGVSCLVVVDTDDVLLICPHDRAQDVKKIVEQLRTNGETQYL